MALALEIRRRAAKIRAEQAKRNAEAARLAEAEWKDAAYLASLAPEERRQELRRREIALQRAQAERNAAVKAGEGAPENKALSGPPENKAARGKGRRGRGG